MTNPGQVSVHIRSAVDYVQSWLSFRRRYLRVPGVQAAVWHDGEVVLSCADGVADLVTGEALRTDHVFRVASHSKTFTATVVCQLHVEGVLRLDDPVGRWVPALEGTPDVAALTLRALLSHASGLTRDGLDGDHWQLRHGFPDEETVLAMARAGAVQGPDVRFKYSNVGYALLGLVIERATGTTYAEAVRSRVVEPLGLTSTTPDLEPSVADRLAGAHSGLAHGQERVPVEQVGTGAMAAATGFCSTATDLVRYAAAHVDGDRLLPGPMRRHMQHGWWQVEQTPTDAYGLGLALTEVGGRRLLGHGGGWPGHITRTLVDPDDALAVSVLTNAVDGPAQELAVGVVRLLDLARGRGATSGRAGGPGATAASGADAPSGDVGHAAERSTRQRTFTGRFANLWGVQDIALLGDRLYGLNPTLPDPVPSAMELEVVDADTLRVVSGPGYANVGEHLRATRDASGRVVELRVGSGMSSWPAEDFRLPERVTPGSLWAT